MISLARPINVGNKVWIGAGAIIFPGLFIGDCAKVAAGSIVTKDVPSRALVAGNHARFICSIDDEKHKVDLPEGLALPWEEFERTQEGK